MSDGARPVLVVLKDGVPLPEEEARPLWTEFSLHMDANRGDMAGFARAKGFFEVRPEYRRGQAVLLVFTTAEEAQRGAPPPPKPKPAPAAKKGGSPPKKGGSPAKKGGNPPKKGGSPAKKNGSPAKKNGSPAKKGAGPRR